MKKSRRIQEEVKKNSRRSREEAEKKPRGTREELKKKSSVNSEDIELEIKMSNRLKYLKFNKAVVYICGQLKDEYSTVNTDSLMNHLQVKRLRAWRILSDLKNYNFIKLKYKANFNEYYGVFNSSNLKLSKFEERAKTKIKDVTPKRRKKNALNR